MNGWMAESVRYRIQSKTYTQGSIYTKLTFHGYYLCISTTSSSPLDTKRRTLTRLSNTSHGRFTPNGTQGLRQANGCGRLAFTKRRWIDTRYNDIVTLWFMSTYIANRQGDFRLGNAPGDNFVVTQAESNDK